MERERATEEKSAPEAGGGGDLMGALMANLARRREGMAGNKQVESFQVPQPSSFSLPTATKLRQMKKKGRDKGDRRGLFPSFDGVSYLPPDPRPSYLSSSFQDESP